MQPDSIPIFISVGRHYRQDEDVLIERIFSVLRPLGLDPYTLPRNQWDFDNPLDAIQSKMSQCRGVLVIAFTRVHIEAAYEWPNSPEQVPIVARDAASVWLQIEAALAFQLALPTLILVEKHLHPEGLLNPKHRKYSALFYDITACQNALPNDLEVALRRFARNVKRHSSPR